MTTRIVVCMAVGALALIAGCRASNDSTASTSGVTGARHGVVRTSGDSLVIRTTDGTMSLGLMNDTVFMGLTDSVLAVARADMARDTEETRNALAGTIERFVKGKVSSALQTRLKYPLAELDSATYSDGAIKFAYRERRHMAFEDVSQNGHKALQSFSPADAQRFVSTLNSAIRKVRGNSR
jgi:hypothetical protein